MMLNEEALKKALEEVESGLAGLPAKEGDLSSEQRKQKFLLTSRRNALKKLVEARKNGRHQQEISSYMDYFILTEWGEKHPWLTHFMRIRTRNNWLG